MDRKAIARETLEILKNGYYQINETQVRIHELQEKSIAGSFLLTPEQGASLITQFPPVSPKNPWKHPKKIAMWWRELLINFFPDRFNTIIFAVYDHSSTQSCFKAFAKEFAPTIR